MTNNNLTKTTPLIDEKVGDCLCIAFDSFPEIKKMISIKHLNDFINLDSTYMLNMVPLIKYPNYIRFRRIHSEDAQYIKDYPQSYVSYYHNVVVGCNLQNTTSEQCGELSIHLEMIRSNDSVKDLSSNVVDAEAKCYTQLSFDLPLDAPVINVLNGDRTDDNTILFITSEREYDSHCVTTSHDVRTYFGNLSPLLNKTPVQIDLSDRAWSKQYPKSLKIDSVCDNIFGSLYDAVLKTMDLEDSARTQVHYDSIRIGAPICTVTDTEIILTHLNASIRSHVLFGRSK